MERHLRHFCKVTSHELSSVFGAVLGELEFSLQTKDNKHQESSIAVAVAAMQRAVHLAQNLRYFAVQTQLVPQPCDLSQLVLDTVDIVESEFQKRQIHFAVLVDNEIVIHTDPAALQHILLNLLWNAAHEMPRGGDLKVTLHKKTDLVEIGVSDTGNGLLPQQLENLFEPYFLRRRDYETADHGLGLAVAKALIDAQGGEISVRSDVGKGTHFVIELPFDPSKNHTVPHFEKRRFRRVRVNLPAELTLDSGRKFLTYITVLSAGGCFISLSQTPESDFPRKGSPVSLRLSHFEGEEIEIPSARVASLLKVGGEAGIGIEFEQMGEKARTVIRALVRSHPTFE